MPIYLFFFLRLLIRSQRDLDGVLQTFLYSSIFVVGVFLFELIVNPIKVLKTRDLERIQGLLRRRYELRHLLISRFFNCVLLLFHQEKHTISL